MQDGGLHLEPSGSRPVLSAVYRESHLQRRMINIQITKQDLRRRLRSTRLDVAPARRAEAATMAAAHFENIPDWSSCQRLALYQPIPEEFDPEPIAAAARSRGLALYLPVINDDKGLSFALWQEEEDLICNRYGIPEPAPHARRLAAAELDMVVLPLVGWDRQGGRLGMGGGYYDRALADAGDVIRVGLGYASQECTSLTLDPWDIPMHFVVTERELMTAPTTV